MSLMTAIIIVLVVLAGAYLINGVLQVPEPIRMILNVCMALAVFWFVLQAAGVVGSLDSIRIGGR